MDLKTAGNHTFPPSPLIIIFQINSLTQFSDRAKLDCRIWNLKGISTHLSPWALSSLLVLSLWRSSTSLKRKKTSLHSGWVSNNLFPKQHSTFSIQPREEDRVVTVWMRSINGRTFRKVRRPFGPSVLGQFLVASWVLKDPNNSASWLCNPFHTLTTVCFLHSVLSLFLFYL